MKAEATLVIFQKSRAGGGGGVTLEFAKGRLAPSSSNRGRRKGGVQELCNSELISTSGMFSGRVHRVDGSRTTGK